jgi:hypothetical protein
MYPSESAISSKSEDSVDDSFARDSDGRDPGREIAYDRGGGARHNRDSHAPDPNSQSHPQETLAAVPAGAVSRWRRALGILVCLEVGLFLFAAPWSPIWTRNLLLEPYPAWQALVMNPFLRGAISGLGLINLSFAFRGIWDFRAGS